MKVMSFHLMPYADLDLSVKDKYRSVWVVLPNTYYDPQKDTRSTTAISTSSSCAPNSASTASAPTSTIRTPTA